ncbi:universal stress protein YxiE [Paenibacillus sp. J23TS9]|uniref:universal stress protein n=1 Tax=Paenibacillus sp. J23TS9 TaxID=2807193 RepID=UPI001B2B7401|nr:universal stress protein [Paenibacillus sp. J23TS9]GIP27707.1 universal stress protein YxiE [Paenibacillus sp. J23TS9]
MYNRILVPVDGSTHAQRALDAAVALIQSLKNEPELAVLHVNPSISINEPPVGIDLEERIREEGEKILAPATEALSKLGVSYQTFSKTGDPSSAICKTAEEQHVDLIIMGSRGIGLMSELLIGSVSHGVVQHAHCPVMIVR